MSQHAEPDTRIMGIVHSALRRDLRRARVVLESGTLTDERRTALARHLAWMMDFLHRHHSSEDEGLYLLMRERDASVGPLLDRMDAEHGAVHPAMERVLAGAAALGERGDRAAAWRP